MQIGYDARKEGIFYQQKPQQPCQHLSPLPPRCQFSSPLNVNFRGKSESNRFGPTEQAITQWRRNLKPNVIGLKTRKIHPLRLHKPQTHISTVTQPQQIVIKLNKIKKLPLNETLFILQSMLIGYSHIFWFFGEISVSLGACGINSEGIPKVWINSDFSSNQPLNPTIKEELKCVHEIMKAVKTISNTSFDDFYHYYIRNASKNKCGFKYSLELIKSYLACTKQKLPSEISLQFLDEEYGWKTQSQGIVKYNQNIFPLTTSKQKKLFKKDSINFRNRIKRNEDRSNYGQSKQQKSIDSFHGSSSYRKFKIENKQQNKKSFNPRNTVGECEVFKQSQISTTQNTNSNKESMRMKESDQVDEIFTNIKKCKIHQSQTAMIPVDEKQPIKVFNLLELLPEKSEELSSKEESSQGKREEEMDENHQFSLKVINENKWVNKVDNLLKNCRTSLKSSRIEGEEHELMKNCYITQKLDKWARLIAQSVISDAV